MTQAEIDELDRQVRSEEISDEEYYGTLRDEVSLLHPDMDFCEVENMVGVQLKSLALGGDYTCGKFETKPPEDERRSESPENGKQAEGFCRAEANAGGETGDAVDSRQVAAFASSGCERPCRGQNQDSDNQDQDQDQDQDSQDNDDGMIWWNFQWVPKWFLGLDPSVLSSEEGPVFIDKAQPTKLIGGAKALPLE